MPARINHKKFPLLFAFIVLSAFLLRFYQLGQKSFWYDEACSLAFASRSLEAIFTDHYLLRPLYFIFLNIWSHVFGINEVVSRFPSVFFGVAAVFLIKKLGEVVFDRRTGSVAAFLLAFSYFHIAWSQQVRNYSLLVFLCLASSFCLFRLVNKNISPPYVVYSIITILAIFTSPIAVFMLIPALFYYSYKGSFFNKKFWRVAHLIIGAAICLLLILAVGMKAVIREDIAVSNSFSPSISSIGILLGVFSCGGGKIAQGATAYIIDGFPRMHHVILFILFFIFYGLGVIWGVRSNKDNFVNVCYLVIWQWFPVILLLLFSFILGISCFSVKYLIFTLPAFYLIVARGLCCIPKKAIVSCVLGILAILTILNLTDYYYPKEYSSWRELTTDLQRGIREKDVIILIPLEQLAPFWLYYDKDKKFFCNVGNGVGGKGIQRGAGWKNYFYHDQNFVWGVKKDRVVFSLEEMIPLVKEVGGRFYWLIVSRDWIGDAQYNAMSKYLNDHFNCLKHTYYPFEGIQLFKLQAKS